MLFAFFSSFYFGCDYSVVLNFDNKYEIFCYFWEEFGNPKIGRSLVFCNLTESIAERIYYLWAIVAIVYKI